MKTLLTIVSLVALLVALPASTFAKKPKPQGAQESGDLRIVQVDPVSVTVSVGLSGDEHFTYKITDSTTVTLNGAPIFARDLKAGMEAKFTLSSDHATALTIQAKDAPAHPGKHRVG